MQKESGAQIHIDTKADPCKAEVSGTAAQVQAAVEMINAYVASSVTEDVRFERGMFGRIVGKGGENVKQVQQESGAHLKVDKTADSCSVTITGSEEQVGAAKEALQRLVGGCRA